MTFAEQIRHPSAALDPPRSASRSVLSVIPWWCWLLGGSMVALILIGIFRPQWLARIGVHVNLSSAAKAMGAVSNQMGWI